MRWKVGLNGNDTGLEDLAESFDDDPDVFEEEGEYRLWSSKFEDLDDNREVRSEAEVIVETIQVFGLRDDLFVEELEINPVYEMQDGSIIHTSYKSEPARIGVRAGPVRATKTLEDGTEVVVRAPADKTYEWTELAGKDEKVAELASLLNGGDDWVNLNRIYEFIKDNRGDDTLADRGWLSGNKQGDFTKTANNRNAIGDEARHGWEGEPISDPMTIEEAQRLIDSLVDDWLHYRQEQLDTTDHDN